MASCVKDIALCVDTRIGEKLKFLYLHNIYTSNGINVMKLQPNIALKTHMKIP